MSALASLIAQSTAIVAGGDGYAYRIRRIRSADLASAGLAELVGAAASDQAVRELQAELRATQGDPEKRAAIEERAREAQEEAAKRHLLTNPRALAAVTERIDRYCCAGVTGIGVAPEGVEAGAVVSVEVEPVSLVMTATTDADHAAGRVWVANLPEETRGLLFDAIEGLSGATKIRPFRGVPRPAAVA